MKEQKQPTKTYDEGQTPFEKFTELTKRLVAVPKKELDKKLVEYERKKKQKSKRQKVKT